MRFIWKLIKKLFGLEKKVAPAVVTPVANVVVANTTSANT